MSDRIVLDLAALPTSSFGPKSLTWWGTVGFMTLEGMGFALAGASYLYLYHLAPQWPLSLPLPDHWPATILTVVLLVSLIPNHLLKPRAEACEMRPVRIGLLVMSALGILPLVIRGFEFSALNVAWDANAYGSMVWVLLGLHTTHLLTDVVDTLVLAALMFTRHGKTKRRFADVADNILYWDFVVLTWLPIYVLIYWLPRF